MGFRKSGIYEFRKLWSTTIIKNKNIEFLGKAAVVKLGKDTLGFQLNSRDGGSGGEKGDISWVYSVDNKMKMVAGCHYEEWRFGPLGVECEPRINSSLKPTEAFIRSNWIISLWNISLMIRLKMDQKNGI